MRISDWSSDVCSSDLWCGGLGRRWSSIWTPILMKPGNAEFLLVFRLRAPSMRCHASGDLFLGGLWAGIAVRRLVRPANPTRLQYLRVGSGQFLAANRARHAPAQPLGDRTRTRLHSSHSCAPRRLSYT